MSSQDMKWRTDKVAELEQRILSHNHNHSQPICASCSNDRCCIESRTALACAEYRDAHKRECQGDPA